MPARTANRTENRQRLMEIMEVVRRHDIFGADVLRVAEVLTEFVEHTQIVAPHGEVVYLILVTLGNQI